MPRTPIARSTANRLVLLILVGMAVQLLVVGYVFFQAYFSRVTVVNNQRSGCERGKLDRRDSADFQTAQKVYIDKVVLAQSVKPDVKKAARTAVKTFTRTSASLDKRSRIDCTKAFPSARLLP
jgi:hypothetical protein